MPPSVLACVPTRCGVTEAVARKVAASCLHAEKAGAASSASYFPVADGYGVAQCRNKAVASFLAGPASHLWFVDDDVHVPPDALAKLLALAARVPLAAGCYPSVRLCPDSGRVSPYLTLRTLQGDWLGGWFAGVREVSAAGTGCLLIARGALEALGFPWFVWRESYEGGVIKCVSDDVDFCDRARALGYRIFADGSVRCGHRKTIDVAGLLG